MSTAVLNALVVRPIRPDEEATWDELMATHHYLGFERLVGESLKYLALLEGDWVALLGWATAAFKCAPRDRWIGWSPEQQWQRLKFLANNQRFLILPQVRQPNLASKCLAMNLRRLSADWQASFGHAVVLAETFVDPRRFLGTCYRAANWLPLGQTRGFGRNGRGYYYHGQAKTIWVRPLHRQAQALLTAPFMAPSLQGKGKTLVDLNRVQMQQPGGLLDQLRQLPDPRRRRGIRHSQCSILAVAICAVLCGHRCYVAIGEWAADQTQSVLQRLGCRRHQLTGRYIPPSEPTIRRTLQAMDPNLVDRVLGAWLHQQTDAQALAVDGKTLRGSASNNHKAIHLLSALVHKQGVVAAQCAVDPKSNEITAFRPLLEPLALTGTVVTADALHAQVDHARYLVEEKQADYLFTAKANQPTLWDDITTLDASDFSPSPGRAPTRPRSS